MPTFTSYDGTELHYDLLGADLDGPAIAVHAGGAARHPEYLGNLAGLDSVRPLALLHQRGVGLSQRPADPSTAAWHRLGADLEALRIHLGLERLDVLGHSAGTRVALAFAAHNPDRIGRLCLVTPPPGWLVETPSDSEELIAARRGEPWFPQFEAALAQETTATTMAQRRALHPGLAPMTWARWNERAQAHERLGTWNLDALEAFFAVPLEEDLLPALRALQAPVLVVAGGSDALLGLKSVVAVAGLFPHGRAVVLDSGHYPWVEQPKTFLDEVGTFFSAAGQST
jgi:pimeloyl-ACP methyl ester carboxylesterase